MNWSILSNLEQIQKIDAESIHKAVMIYKHSTRCGISSTALNRIERSWKEADALLLSPYFLDLLAHRNISNEIERHYNIPHESPQVLLIKSGKCVYSTSHMDINMPEVLRHIVG